MRYGERTNGAARLILAVPTALPRHMRGPIVEIREFSTDRGSRGLGHATALMLATTLEADMGRYILFLCVEPEDDTDKQRLLSFYERHGFVAIQADPILMARPPVIGGLPTLQ